MIKHCYKIFSGALLWLAADCAAVQMLTMETKNFDNQTFVIVHHSNKLRAKTSLQNKKLTFVFDEPVELNALQDIAKQSLIGSEKQSDDLKSVVFYLKGSYDLVQQIDGEKLTAAVLKAKEQKGDLPNPNMVEILKSGRATELIFPWHKQVASAVFINDQHLWIVFDQSKTFSIPQNNRLKLQQIPNEEYAMLRLPQPTSHDFKVIKRGLKWVISMDERSSANGAMVPSKEAEGGQIVVKNFGQLRKIIDIREPATDHRLLIVPATSLFNQKKREQLAGAQLISSLQGVVIKVSGERPLIVNQGRDLLIKEQRLPPYSFDKPVFDRELFYPSNPDIRGFATDLRKLTQNLADPDADASYQNHLALAKFYFSHELFFEAIAVLKQAGALHAQVFDRDFTANVLLAVNQVLANRYAEAYPIFQRLIEDNLPSAKELELWYNYCRYKLDKNASNIDLSQQRFVRDYADILYWPLVTAELEVKSAENASLDYKNLLWSLRSPHKAIDHNNIAYYKAKYYLKTEQAAEGVQILRDLAKQQSDSYNRVRATLLLVDHLSERASLSPELAAQKLDSLRFVWRGDKLEYQLLKSLGQYQQKSLQTAASLRTYAYATKYLANWAELQLSAHITDLYKQLFSTEVASNTTEEFQRVALFYEFSDLVPIGTQGDQVAIRIANHLINLGLLEKASSLLEHQIQYRQKGMDKLLTADHLALVYLMDNKPQAAIDILNYTDQDNTDYSEYLRRLKIKAKAYIDLKLEDKALRLLNDQTDEDALFLKKEIYFMSKDWQAYIALAEQPLLSKIAAGNLAKTDSQDILHLAICYSMTDQDKKLSKLESILKDTSPELQIAITFLKGMSSIDYSILDKILEKDQLKSLIAKYKQILFD